MGTVEWGDGHGGQSLHASPELQAKIDFYPRESFREGLCYHRRTFVCLSVCYHDN